MRVLSLYVLVLAMFAAACQAHGSSAPLIRPGKYAGSCLQTAAFLGQGTTFGCVDKGSVVAVPYYVEWTKKGSKLQWAWSGDATNLTSAKGNKYGYPGTSIKPTDVDAVEGCSGCLTTLTSKGPSYFRAYTQKVGRTWTYVEEGLQDVPTGKPLANGCQKDINPPLYCNSKVFNYRCVALEVASHY